MCWSLVFTGVGEMGELTGVGLITAEGREGSFLQHGPSCASVLNKAID